ncbi:MAG: hypothetical protein PGN23_15750 [Sphingomonas adhaesiva]|uniref:hypothetical protein n=1 Tax=Sphingomonas adhaesiva TaxID=28212 RepID=UPI002FF9B330
MSKLVPAAISLLLLAACGRGEGTGNEVAARPTPASTLPPPRTPVMQVSPAPGNEASWLEPRPDGDAPTQAPYGNLLDQPLVGAAKK